MKIIEANNYNFNFVIKQMKSKDIIYEKKHNTFSEFFRIFNQLKKTAFVK